MAHPRQHSIAGARSAAVVRATPLGAERALRAPLGALRVMLEGLRSDGPPARLLLDRALHEVDRVDAAASDFFAWSSERPVRSTPCTMAELVSSLRTTLDTDDRARCHLVLEGDDTQLLTDGRLLVDALARSIRHRLAAVTEVMVHAHVEDDRASFTVVDAPDKGDLIDLLEHDAASPTSLADELLARDLGRLGGTVSQRATGAHRCLVIGLPLRMPRTNPEVMA